MAAFFLAWDAGCEVGGIADARFSVSSGCVTRYALDFFLQVMLIR